MGDRYISNAHYYGLDYAEAQGRADRVRGDRLALTAGMAAGIGGVTYLYNNWKNSFSSSKSMSRKRYASGYPPTPAGGSGTNPYNLRSVRRRITFGDNRPSGGYDTVQYINTGASNSTRSIGTGTTRRSRPRRSRGSGYSGGSRRTGRRSWGRFVRRGKGAVRRIRKRSRKVNKYNMSGSSKVIENGSTLSDSHAIYVGHSIPAVEFGRSICAAIIRELFRQKGENISRWSDLQKTSATTESLCWSYYASETATVLSTIATIALDPTKTYESLANDLFADWVAKFSVGQLPRLHQIYIATQSGNIVSACVNCAHVTATYSFKSILKIQNTSLGGVSDSADNDDDVDDSITRNPLIGKIFNSKKRLNGFDILNRPQSDDASYAPLIAHNTVGWITCQGSTMVSPDLVKVPTKTALGAYSQKSVRLEPGEIKIFKISKVHKVKLSTIWSKYGRALDVAGGTAGARLELGPAQLIGLEKLLDSKIKENAIKCQFELVQKHQTMLKKHGAFCATLVAASTTT